MKKKSKRKPKSLRWTKDEKKRAKQKKMKHVKAGPKIVDQILYRPGVAELDATLPKGFRAVGMAQGMLEYSGPILDLIEDDKETKFHDAFNLGSVLWNLALVHEKGEQDNKLVRKIINALRHLTKKSDDEIKAFIDKMVERHAFLFPPEMQIKDMPMLMIIRTENPVVVSMYDYGNIKLSNVSIPPDESDLKLIKEIEELDKCLDEGRDYDEWETKFFSIKDGCIECFAKWFKDKDASEEMFYFVDCPSIFIDFVYAYAHDDVITLKSCRMVNFEEFFFDFLLRKMTVEPSQYTEWPPALKYFYRFLHEKGYIRNPEPFISRIDKIEQPFIELLRKRYS